MLQKIIKWLKLTHKRVITSIAFLPAVIAIAFLLLSYAAIEFDYSTTGKSLKSRLHWLSLKDASTARSICSVVTGGVISLTVFSFSMVMILLNQAASQMSNRILGRLIGNRFQQVVLGFYIGTIVYGLFLLSTIRDIDSGIYVPALSTYLLIAFTVIDIFLFIYFLHYITNSVKYDTIINGIYTSTSRSLKKIVEKKDRNLEAPEDANPGCFLTVEESGFFLGFNQQSMLEICSKENARIYFLHPIGTYLLKGTPLFQVNSANMVSEKTKNALTIAINISKGQEGSENFNYGFQQLMEIAVKALSPGINDPETAVISLHALCNLLAYRLDHVPDPVIPDEEDVIRIVLKAQPIEEILDRYLLPIWDYGKHDRVIQNEMINLLPQLLRKAEVSLLADLLHAAISEREKLLL